MNNKEKVRVQNESVQWEFYTKHRERGGGGIDSETLLGVGAYS